jgi:hypothetical protein
MSEQAAADAATRVWLYVRDGQSVRVELAEGGSLAISGPGDAFQQHDYGDDVAALIEHSAVEQQLVRDGWSLERMTTDRRTGTDRRTRTRGERRRLHLVR